MEFADYLAAEIEVAKNPGIEFLFRAFAFPKTKDSAVSMPPLAFRTPDERKAAFAVLKRAKDKAEEVN